MPIFLRSALFSPLAIVIVVTLTPCVVAEFLPPARISDPEAGPVDSYTMGLDFFGLTHIVYSQRGRLITKTRGGTLDQDSELARGAYQPHLAFYPVGLFATYTVDADSGRRVDVRARVGAILGESETRSEEGADASHPRVRLDANRRPHLIWEESTRGQTEILYRGPDSDPQDVGPGSAPQLEVDARNRLHALFLRDGRMYYSTDSPLLRGRLGTPREILPGAGIVVQPPSLGLHPEQFLYVAYIRDGELFLADDRNGSFEARSIASRVTEASLRVTTSGIVALAFVQGTAIHYVLGNSFFLPDPQMAFESNRPLSSPLIDADNSANAFLSFVEDDQVYLTTNAGPPVAAFELDVNRGPAPLEVNFTDTSRGDVNGWLWDFGDGVTSTQQHPTHRYEKSGEYVARLHVSGPAGTSQLLSEREILVTAPGIRMWIPDTRSIADQSIQIPVFVSHDRPAQGFQIAARFLPSILTVLEVDFWATNIGPMEPELHLFKISNDPDDPFVTAGVLLDIEPPFDRRVLPPGSGRRLINILAEVSPDAPGGAHRAIWLENGIGRPEINNVLIVSASSVVPVLGEAGLLHISTIVFPPPRFFIRGDIDRSGGVSISDAISILNFLFLGGDEPYCKDAADADDSGRLDLTDAAFILNFLFRAGNYLPFPYPDAGLDPTPDDMSDCLFF